MYQYLLTNTKTLPDDDKHARRIIIEADHYILEEGMLYRLFNPRTRGTPETQGVVRQVALPESQRYYVLSNYHDNKAGGGHLGKQKTYDKIKMKYYWPGMYQDKFDYVSKCDICQRIKVDRHPHPPPLTPMPQVKPFEKYHMDILGTFPKTKEGYQYILLIVDSGSRWPECFPLRTQEAKEVAQVLYNEVFTRYGSSLSIVSDRGRNFMSRLVQALCDLFNIKRHYTSSYHPMTNSTCERMNSVILQTMRAYVPQNQENWHTYLPSIMMAIRASPNEALQTSPYEMLFGEPMRLPVDLIIPKPSLGSDGQQFSHLYWRS